MQCKKPKRERKKGRYKKRGEAWEGLTEFKRTFLIQTSPSFLVSQALLSSHKNLLLISNQSCVTCFANTTMDVAAVVTHIPTISSAAKLPFNVPTTLFVFQPVAIFVIFREL